MFIELDKLYLSLLLRLTVEAYDYIRNRIENPDSLDSTDSHLELEAQVQTAQLQETPGQPLAIEDGNGQLQVHTTLSGGQQLVATSQQPQVIQQLPQPQLPQPTIQIQSAPVSQIQQSPTQTIIQQAQSQQQFQSPGQQLIWHNQRLYAIVPQGTSSIHLD